MDTFMVGMSRQDSLLILLQCGGEKGIMMIRREQPVGNVLSLRQFLLSQSSW